MPLLITLGLHMAGSLFWLLTSLVLGWNNNPAASGPLFRPQMIGATVAVFSGGGLWQLLHVGGFGPREMVLALGGVLAIAATGVQGMLVGANVRRLPDPLAAAKITRGQRIAAGLLAVALACMLAERYV
jgi:hypothetical protein